MIGRNVAVASRRRPFSGASRSVINPINMKDSLHLADHENPPCHSKIQNQQSTIPNPQHPSLFPPSQKTFRNTAGETWNM